MTVNRRVLYGMAGAALVAAVLYIHWANWYSHRPSWNLAGQLTWAGPYSTVADYSVSAAGFYLLTAGAIGCRLRSRHWATCLTAALALASLLVVGILLAAYGEFSPRHLTYDG